MKGEGAWGVMKKERYPFIHSFMNGEQGWHSGESTRLPPMCPGFDSLTRCHMWFEFVVGSRPCSEGFSPGSPVFLPPQKNTPNSNSTTIEDPYENQLRLMWLAL